MDEARDAPFFLFLTFSNVLIGYEAMHCTDPYHRTYDNFELLILAVLGQVDSLILLPQARAAACIAQEI